MKSLDKINDLIDMSKTGNGTWRLCDCTEDFELIKADLEVLEILQVLILHNGKSVGYKGIIRDFEVMLRLGKITKEQLDRFKQWLEENQ